MNSSTQLAQSSEAIIASANALLAQARAAHDEGQAWFAEIGIDPSRIAEVVAHARVHGLHAPLHELIAARGVPRATTQTPTQAGVPKTPKAMPLPGRGVSAARPARRRTPMV